MRRTRIFGLGFLAGLAALGFNFLLRLGGVAPFPPESALNAFLTVIPASIEEPMVQEFGDFAGQLGLLTATLIAAAVYGSLFLAFDKYAAKRLSASRLNAFEALLLLGVIPWFLFGLVVFPVDGDSLFGMGSVFAYTSQVGLFPFTLLLAQGVFALVLSLWYQAPGRGMVPPPQGPGQDVGRRTFIEKGGVGVLAVIGVLAGLSSIGSLFSSQLTPTGGSQPVDLQNAPAIFRDPRLATLVESEVTPNADFYRVAIDVIDPVVNPADWSLKVDGLVNSPKSFLLLDVQSFPAVSQYVTFECVSNKVNGNLIGNARWGGVKVSDILANAGGVQSDAQYVVFYSVDGYSVGIPIEKALMADSILAYDMNGQQLPVKNGYPLRVVIPGLYGMMSAKWINRISVVGSVYQGYWQTRGWTNNAAIYTETFIALPGPGQQSISQHGGSVIVAGYAFAGDRGVSKVEVSFDNGKTWQLAQLKQPISNLTWALWAYEWRPSSPGDYLVIARATDGTGQVQTQTVSDTYPNGATGYVSTTVSVVN